MDLVPFACEDDSKFSIAAMCGNFGNQKIFWPSEMNLRLGLTPTRFDNGHSNMNGSMERKYDVLQNWSFSIRLIIAKCRYFYQASVLISNVI